MSFRIVDLIESKKLGDEHSSEQLSWLVSSFTEGKIPDYQMSAWLMAVCLRGMSDDEAISMTKAMVGTGDILNLSIFSQVKLDKHSSGGVGDKVTLAFVPILAAANAKIAKMSGHGLGYTGGTLDKLESIPGFRTSLAEAEILNQVGKVGACICAQTDSLVPADKLIYALRDVTGTVDSTPLIASSIMSKKIACGADVILLDIKVGSGAFMKSRDKARNLAKLCVKIGNSYGKQVTAVLTDMNQPLGRAIGNRIEVQEAVEFLQGKIVDARLRTEILALCNIALELIGSDTTAQDLIDSGAALKKWEEIVAAQSHPAPASTQEVYSTNIYAPRSGFITEIDAQKIGTAAAMIGTGRVTKSDKPDPNAGIWLQKIVGDNIEAGAILASMQASKSSALSDDARDEILDAFTFSNEPHTIDQNPILERIN